MEAATLPLMAAHGRQLLVESLGDDSSSYQDVDRIFRPFLQTSHRHQFSNYEATNVCFIVLCVACLLFVVVPSF